MTIDDIKFRPHSDMNIDGQEIVNQHQKLINNNRFSDATALLNNNNYQNGFRASLFNTMQYKVHLIQEHLLTKAKDDSDEVISSTEPVNSDMQFWLADY